jgi:hypothetical protein
MLSMQPSAVLPRSLLLSLVLPHSTGQSGNWFFDADYPGYTSIIKVDAVVPTFGMFMIAQAQPVNFAFSTLDGTLLANVWLTPGNNPECPLDCPQCINPLPPSLFNPNTYVFDKPVGAGYLRMDVTTPCGGAYDVTIFCNGADVAPPAPAAHAVISAYSASGRSEAKARREL